MEATTESSLDGKQQKYNYTTKTQKQNKKNSFSFLRCFLKVKRCGITLNSTWSAKTTFIKKKMATKEEHAVAVIQQFKNSRKH